MSDLHLEFSNGHMELPVMPDEENTVLVLAGDIGIAHKPNTYLSFLTDLNDRFKRIIYILGNHEHYHGNFPKTLNIIRDNCKDLDNVHVLEKETLVIDDVAFVCATMWSDFDEGDPLSMYQAEFGMNDFRIIRTGPKAEPWKRKFKPTDAYAEFSRAKGFIFPEIIKHKELGHKVVVVTHHAPSHESSALEYQNVPTAGAYASDLQDDIIETKPNLFIHGHMHSSADYMIGDTRILLNPRGYEGYELNPDFNPSFTVVV